MAILFLVLFCLKLTGTLWHEIMGLVLAGLVMVHVGYNYKYILGFSKKYTMAKKTGFTRAMLMDMINILLLALFIVIVVTGIGCSHTLFAGGNKEHQNAMNIHIICSLAALALVVLHVFLHIRMIKTVFEKMRKPIKIGVISLLVVASLYTVFVIGSDVAWRLFHVQGQEQKQEQKRDQRQGQGQIQTMQQ